MHLYTMGITTELTYKPLPNGGNLSLTCGQIVCMLGGFRESAVINVVNKSEGGSVATIHTPHQLFHENHPLVEAPAACNN